jgi:chromosome segregation ATPase
MGRTASITYDQVKAVADALHAEGRGNPTIDEIWEALGRVGSKGTIHQLVKRYRAESKDMPKTSESLRVLPADIQRAILAFADRAATMARDGIDAELVERQQEADSLAEDNKRRVSEIDELRLQLEQAMSEKAGADAMAAALAQDLAVARAQVDAQRAAAEQARTELAKAELRLEALGPLQEELRQARAACDAEHEARTAAERAAAVLAAQKKEHEERISELNKTLANARAACDRLEARNAGLLEEVKREQQARTVAERELAVLNAVQPGVPGKRPRSAKGKGHPQAPQKALWQADGDGPNKAASS